MKNKKNFKYLLGAVIIIWGIISYQIFKMLTPDTLDNDIPIKKTKTIAKINKKDTFIILPIERDPFLGKLYKKSISTKPNKKTIVKKETIWPSIRYLGIVADNSTTSDKIHIIEINGQQYLAKQKDTIRGIKLIKTFNDKISLLYKGDSKIFSIE